MTTMTNTTALSRAASTRTARPTTRRCSTSSDDRWEIESSPPPRSATGRCCGLQTHGQVQRVGVEGTGSYGAALSRHLRAAGVTVVEVDRPDRKARRAHGKSDPLDALCCSGRADRHRQQDSQGTRRSD